MEGQSNSDPSLSRNLFQGTEEADRTCAFAVGVLQIHQRRLICEEIRVRVAPERQGIAGKIHSPVMFSELESHLPVATTLGSPFEAERISWAYVMCLFNRKLTVHQFQFTRVYRGPFTVKVGLVRRAVIESIVPV